MEPLPDLSGVGSNGSGLFATYGDSPFPARRFVDYEVFYPVNNSANLSGII